MKNLNNLKRIALTLFISAALFACKSDDEGGSGGDAASGTVEAKVAGSNYKSDKQGTQAQRIESQGTTTILITSNEFSSGKNITLTISSGFDGIGTYQIGGGPNVFVNAQYVEGNANDPLDSQIWSAPFDESVAGEINVSAVSDSNIKGTFSFTGKNEDGSFKEVTEGSFNVDFN